MQLLNTLIVAGDYFIYVRHQEITKNQGITAVKEMMSRFFGYCYTLVVLISSRQTYHLL